MTVIPDLARSTREHIDVPHGEHGTGEFGTESVEVCVCSYYGLSFCIVLQVLIGGKQALIHLEILVVNLVQSSGSGEVKVHRIGAARRTLCFQKCRIVGVEGRVRWGSETVGERAAMRHPDAMRT